MCYVYVIASGMTLDAEEAEFYDLAGELPSSAYPVSAKIGIAKRPRDRLATLQTGNPSKLSMLLVTKFPTRDLAQKIEKQIHRYLKQSRLGGGSEWFELVEGQMEWLEDELMIEGIYA